MKFFNAALLLFAAQAVKLDATGRFRDIGTAADDSATSGSSDTTTGGTAAADFG